MLEDDPWLWAFRNRPLLWEAAGLTGSLLTQFMVVYKLSSAPKSFLTLLWTAAWNITFPCISNLLARDIKYCRCFLFTLYSSFVLTPNVLVCWRVVVPWGGCMCE